MGARFRKSIKVAPGMRINVGKTGLSASLGRRGTSVTMCRQGTYLNLGVPGTGISFRTKLSGTFSSYQSELTDTTSSASATPATTTEPLAPAHADSERLEVRITILDDGTPAFLDKERNVVPLETVIEVIPRRQLVEQLDMVLREECERINQGMQSLLNIHLGTPSPHSQLTYVRKEFDLPMPSPPETSFTVPRPEPPEALSQSPLAKFISSYRKRVEEQNQITRDNYETELARWEAAKAEFEFSYKIAKQDFDLQIDLWEQQRMLHEKKEERRKRLIEGERFHNIDAMQEILGDVFGSIQWPRETYVSFQIEDNGRKVMLDVDLPEIEDMPEQEALYDPKKLKLNITQRSPTQIRKDYLTHIHAVGFRFVGEVFVALPTVDTVVISAYSQRTNPLTGHVNDEYLYSARVNRSKWEEINFDELNALDVVNCFSVFEIRRQVTSRGIISQVEPFSF